MKRQEFFNAAYTYAAVAVIIVFTAVFLGTCELLSPEDIATEWTDVEYEITGKVGNERVKTIKLYFKPDGLADDVKPGAGTYGVPLSRQQRAIRRALTLDTAASSHDYFEAVFVADATYVARAAWEIGEPAGIGGVRRDVYYGNLYPEATNGPASTVFVGKKTGKTLLGVGWLTHINDIPIAKTSATAGTLVTDSTTSVTYYVAPLKTWVGYYSVTTGTAPVVTNYYLRGRSSWYSPLSGTPPVEADANNTEFMTFLTATTLAATQTAGATNAAWVAPGNLTRANTIAKRTGFNPSGDGMVYYPVYALPKTTDAAPASANLLVQYKIGGLEGLPAEAAGTDIVNPGHSGSTTNNPVDTLWPAVRVFGKSGTPTATQPRGALQVIKRRPTFVYKGRTYQAKSTYDSNTKIDVWGAYRTAQDIHAWTIPALPAAQESSGDTASVRFDSAIQFGVTVSSAQGGIFAFTWQCPVFAITTRYSDNGGGRFTKWFIRPADGKDLYLLDNGADDGGMVMLGDIADTGDDWIQIITTGIGFTND